MNCSVRGQVNASQSLRSVALQWVCLIQESLFVGSSEFGSSLALDLPTKDAANFLLVGPRESLIFLKLESKKW
jgi:hypothetical protein